MYMNILKKTSPSQAFFLVCGVISVVVMTLLPNKQLWNWFLIAVVLVLVFADVLEIFRQSKEKNYLEKPVDLTELPTISKVHQIMRQTILNQIDVAKPFMQRYTANGYFDGHSLRLVDTQTVALCTITLESSRNYNPVTEEGRSYDMERTYCIMKDASHPVRTISDALLIYAVDGATHIETWVPIDSKEWMHSDEHVASTLELNELLGYLKCISEVQ